MGNKDTKLKIIIDAQDNTKGALKSVNAELGQTQKVAAGAFTAFKVMAAAGAAAAAAFSAMGLKVSADLESARMGLITLLGSAEAADKTIARIKQEALRTPFSIPGLTQATQLLSSVTKDGNRSVKILMDVGEALVSMGKGQAELDRIIVNLQQVGAIGYASMVDIKQFAFAGIPIFEMLQKETGLTGEAFEDFISNGKVTFEMLTTMFDKANDSGGQFFEGFKNQSGTFNQSLASLQEAFSLFASDIVNNSGLFDGLKVAMQGAAEVLQNYRTHVGALKTTISEFFRDLDAKTGLVTMFKEAWEAIAFMWQTRLKPALDELWIALQPYKPFLEALAQVFGTMLVIAIGAAIIILGGLAVALIEILTTATKLYTFLLNTFSTVWDFIVEKISKVIDTIDKLIGWFKKGMDAASNFLNKTGSVLGGSNKSKSVNDAIISPDGNIITTHPDDYLIATKNPASLIGGGGLVINITGNTLLDEHAATKMGDLIFKQLRLSNML